MAVVESSGLTSGTGVVGEDDFSGGFGNWVDGETPSRRQRTG